MFDLQAYLESEPSNTFVRDAKAAWRELIETLDIEIVERRLDPDGFGHPQGTLAYWQQGLAESPLGNIETEYEFSKPYLQCWSCFRGRDERREVWCDFDFFGVIRSASRRQPWECSWRVDISRPSLSEQLTALELRAERHGMSLTVNFPARMVGGNIMHLDSLPFFTIPRREFRRAKVKQS